MAIVAALFGQAAVFFVARMYFRHVFLLFFNK